MSEIFASTWDIVLVVFGLGVLVFVHELGHFIISIRSGIRVEAFSIGFGPALWKIKRGNTEYRISMIPLGGYVKPAGENPDAKDAKGAADEFMSQPPLVRAKVYVAGAIMNFLVAFPLCIIGFWMGINFIAPEVGDIKPGSAEANSTMQKGDKIASILRENSDGSLTEYPVLSQNDYSREILRVPLDTRLQIKLDRNHQPATATLITKGSTGLGLAPPMNVIAAMEPDFTAANPEIKEDDEIIEVDGKPVLSGEDIIAAIEKRGGKKTEIKLRRPTGETTTTNIIPDHIYDLAIDGSVPVIVQLVVKKKPAAKAGIAKKDKIIAIDNVPVKSWKKFSEIVKASAGKQLEFKIIRKHLFSKDETLVKKVEIGADQEGKGFVGISPYAGNEIGEIRNDSILSTTGLAPGDRIVALSYKTKDGKSVQQKISNLMQLQIITTKTKDTPLDITVIGSSPNDSVRTVTIVPKETEKGILGIELKPKMVKIQYSFFAGISAGVKETWDLVVLTYQVVAKLFNGEESASGLSGPIGIIKVSYSMAHEGLSNLLWLLALISLNLGIVNLLPIPVMDGGAIVFCFIERIKGKPLSLKTQVVAQYVGLSIILLLVILTTYNDILNFIL